MKKVFAILISLLMALTIMCSAAYAEIYISPGEDPEDIIIDPTGGPLVPDVIEFNGQTIVEGKAIIVDEYDVPVESAYIVVTPYARKDQAVVPEITELLNHAHAQIKEIGDLDDLTSDFTPHMEASIKEAVKNGNKEAADLTIKDFEITELFDVSLISGGQRLAQRGCKLICILGTELKETDLWFVLHNYEGEKWEVVEGCELNGRELTIPLSSLSPIIFVKQIDKSELVGPVTSADSANPAGTVTTTGSVDSESQQGKYDFKHLAFLCSCIACGLGWLWLAITAIRNRVRLLPQKQH